MSRPIRNFTEMLGLLSRGRFAEKCDEHLAEALKTLEELPAEKGTATLDLKITIVMEGGRVDIRPTVKSKLPEEKAFGSTPFWAVDGALSVQHPSQADMFPREASAERARDFA